MAPQARGERQGVHIGGNSRVYATNIAGETINVNSQLNQSRLDEMFRSTEEIIRGDKSEKGAQAEHNLELIKQELLKGKGADNGLTKKLVDGIVDLVPSAIKSLATAFGSPVLASISGSLTKHLLRKAVGL